MNRPISVDVMPAHFDAVEAQIRLGMAQMNSALVQLNAMRQTWERQQAPETPVVTVNLPERCVDYEPSRCMLQDAEGVSSGGFGVPRRMCPGCGVEAD